MIKHSINIYQTCYKRTNHALPTPWIYHSHSWNLMRHLQKASFWLISEDVSYPSLCPMAKISCDHVPNADQQVFSLSQHIYERAAVVSIWRWLPQYGRSVQNAIYVTNCLITELYTKPFVETASLSSV